MVWFTYEECKLCREHCIDPNNRQKIIDWPALSYPGSDQSCVGYCPSEYLLIISLS